MKYRFSLILPLLLFLFSGCSYLGTGKTSGLETITPELIQKHVLFLASDSLKGRKTPSPELDIAANYIAGEFKACGLSPLNGSYLQKINFGKVNLGKENYLTISRSNKETSFRIKAEFMPFEMTGNKEARAAVVFAGYGITAPEYNYDDYSSIDVKGKIVFILKHEPGENDSLSVFLGKKATLYSQINEKVENALAHGASGVMIATDPANHMILNPQGFPWPSLFQNIPADAIPITIVTDEKNKIPVVQVGKEVITCLFGSVDSLKSLQKKIDASFKAASFEMPDYRVSLKTSTEITITPAYNPVAFLEGSDPELKSEVVILGAHYDHVGFIKDHAPGADYIFNGADDNASGTAGMLSVAKAYANKADRPKRSLLFIAFAGEEIGLYGSKAYVNDPLFPIRKTVAMINLDMIGRNNPDTLYLIGSTRCPDLAEISRQENSKIGFTFDYSLEKHLGSSDQASFINKGVPAIFFNTGDHKDYHKVTDEIRLLNFEKASRVAKLAFLTIWRLANDNQHYKVLSKTVSLF